MSYSLVPASSAELVLCVNQGARSRKLARQVDRQVDQQVDRRLAHGAEPRALSKRLSHAAARIERTREYQLSLNRVLELGQRFQQGLEPAQKERWLALEDALLEHTSRLNQAYFRAGAQAGAESRRQSRIEPRIESRRELDRQASHLRSRSHRAGRRCRKAAGELAREVELIGALAELIRKRAAR